MKKLIALLLALTVMMSFAACGATETKETTPATTEAATEAATEATEAASEETEVMTYEEFAAAELESPVVVETTIQAAQAYSAEYGNTSLYAQSEDGAYFIYRMACTAEEYETLTAGTVIRVSGIKAEWSGEVEITEATFEIVEEGEAFEAEALDVTELLASEDLVKEQNKKVAIKGLTFKSLSYKEDEADKDIYVTFELDGAEYEFCVEAALAGPDSDVYKAVAQLQEGEKVNLEGFLYWYEGPNTHITAVETA